MPEKSCTGPNCHSTATPGRCARTARIIGTAEINKILAIGSQDKVYYDGGSDSNLIVYNGTWVAFMDGNTMASGKKYYEETENSQRSGGIRILTDIKFICTRRQGFQCT